MYLIVHLKLRLHVMLSLNQELIMSTSLMNDLMEVSHNL